MKTVESHGCPLAYWDEGDAGDTAERPKSVVFFIQGTAVQGAAWEPQFEAAEGFRKIWFDNRGMAKSVPRGSASITVEQMAEDARAILDDAGVESAHIVGHSLGGCIALELALQDRSRIKSLTLMCTAANGPGLVKMSLDVMWRGLRISVGTKRSRRAAFLEIVLTEKEHRTLDLDEVAERLGPLFGHDLGDLPVHRDEASSRDVEMGRDWAPP